jgi:hypothetical protein
MSQNISGYLSKISVIASNTFPLTGVYLQDFADDVDPFEFSELTIADTKMAVNGQLLKWTTANAIPAKISVIPDSYSDIQLALLLEENRAGYGKTDANDVITMVVYYTNGNFVTFNNGYIISGPTASGLSSAGRLKSKTYSFMFENKTGGI